ncbi:hypothetical protein FA15DRAFT_704598 [Coprinopsis marcescibilis]|uniref:RNA-binding protein VTS1 n=1 Tax=Coprinopsis marcescibilis TaxID=230819 RepID=A0A5C3KVX0_COPMA|nr:hypothetical protein FA15DRAFT_704598 [Coprinopsis marcescibilis]
MSLRPPSTSPSPSPGPADKISVRQSMGPSARGTPTLAPASPRPGGQGSARPTSELLGSGAMFQTPEAEALDQWFENLQNYEATLEDMAAASLDVNFKEELSAIEQWFKVLSEAERTAALYSLLQHSTQVQIRFFITVLQQMARSDPMTALLSPAMGSMQSQMEAKLASIKSPGLKSGLPASPTARNFTPGNRQSVTLDTTYLSPDSAAIATPTISNDAAATLAQQRAKLNASHRISAPVLASSSIDRASWGPSQLTQVSEQQAPAQEIVMNASRPKSSDFSGTIASPRLGESGQSDSWASMVSTPLIPMFKDTRSTTQATESAPKSDSHWSRNNPPAVPRMGDPTTRRRTNKVGNNNNGNDQSSSGGVYDDNGNPIGNQQQPGSGMRNVSGGWSGARSPALSNASSNRFGDDNSNNGMNGLGMQMNGYGVGLGSPGLGMGIPGMGVPPLSPFNMNMGMLSAMGMTPEAQAQLLAAQMAASGFGQPNFFGMQPLSAGINQRRGPSGGRSPGLKSASSVGSRGDATPKGEEDVNPELLGDIPAWLRSLRLHKYTPNFEGCNWQDMVLMDEAALEAKGVAALGARRKMMKTFELVRKKMGIDEGPPPSAPPSAAPSIKSP